MNFIKNIKGSATIEATISLITIITAVITFSMFIKVVYIHGIVQHAIIQTANEMAEYSYFYSLTGLDDINSSIGTATNEGREDVNNFIDDCTNFYNDISNGNFLSASLPGEFDIKQVLIGFMTALTGNVYGQDKTTLINNTVTIPVFNSYLPESKEDFLKDNLVIQGVGNNGIDFSQSKYFENTDGYNEIEIVAVYNIKFVTPIPLIKHLTVVQTAKSRAFFNSD